MPRATTLRFWAKRQVYFMVVAGKKIMLGKDKRRAEREFHRIMADPPHKASEVASEPTPWIDRTFAELNDAYIEEKSLTWDEKDHARHGAVVKLYIARYGHESIRIFNVVKFKTLVSQHQLWNNTTRHYAFSRCAAVFNWAVRRKLLSESPLKGVENFRLDINRRALDQGEYETLKRECECNPALHWMVRLLWATGARPGELIDLTAGHLDKTDPKATFKPHEWKNGSKTGKSRVIVFPDDMMPEIREMAIRHPSGAIFRRQDGEPWRAQLPIQFKVRRLHCGWGPDVVPYSLRHGYGTIMANSGMSLAVLADLMGTSVAMIMKHYYHGKDQTMIEMVRKFKQTV